MSDRLSEIEDRIAAATPGPWELGEVTPMPDGWPGFYADVEPNIGGGLDPHDADLIAHAPADLAALVAVVRAVLGVADALDAQAAHLKGLGVPVVQTPGARIRSAVGDTLDAP